MVILQFTRMNNINSFCFFTFFYQIFFLSFFYLSLSLFSSFLLENRQLIGLFLLKSLKRYFVLLGWQYKSINLVLLLLLCVRNILFLSFFVSSHKSLDWLLLSYKVIIDLLHTLDFFFLYFILRSKFKRIYS